MADSSPSTQLPADLHLAITLEAKIDAVMVDLFLRKMAVPPDDSIPLPRDFLLALGCIMRLARWEVAGFGVCSEYDLPTSGKILAKFVAALDQEDWISLNKIAELRTHLIDIATERFAWNALNVFGAEVELGEIDDDYFIETLARFIWENRHTLSEA